MSHLMPGLKGRSMNHAAVILAGFSTALLIGTGLLMLPVSTVHEGGIGVLPALFTATSALCVTGLTNVNTASYWTHFGQAVIICLIQVGGFGVMSFATILGQAVIRRANLNANLISATERRSPMGGVPKLLKRVLGITITVELLVATALTIRFLTLGFPLHSAIWHGAFHAISAFNNAGFSLFPENLVPYVGDWFICVPLITAIVIGGLGFPVLFQLRNDLFRPYRWTLHTRMVLFGTAALLVTSSLVIIAFEWFNPKTLGKLPVSDAILAGIFQAVQTRTTGFNSIDIGQMFEPTLFFMDILMFIGGGPAGTAGGIKITTLFVLLATVASVVRGRKDATAFGKGISIEVVRQAITVTILSFTLVVVATLALLVITDFSLSQVLFEVLSAFGTVGLSTGITPQLGDISSLIIIVLMIVGRLGPITVATALALAPKSAISLPKERPIIG